MPRPQCLILLACVVLGTFVECACSDETAPAAQRIRIAFTSLRDGRYSGVYVYELDPSGTGKILGRVPAVGKRSDHHPALSKEGSRCIFAAEVVGSASTIEAWDFVNKQAIPLASVNKSPNAQMAPSLADSANIVAFEAWNRPGSRGRWDVLLYDLKRQTFIDTVNLNTTPHDERKPTISADGRWIAVTTNAYSKQSLTDIVLYDRNKESPIHPAGLNSPQMDTDPAISADGRWIAFSSDRPNGIGARDIYLYDRTQKSLVELPGLNSVGQEQSPTISADGRFIAFVSERLDGAGERDLFVYDRSQQRLIPTPNLNSGEDEYDPVIVAGP